MIYQCFEIFIEIKYNIVPIYYPTQSLVCLSIRFSFFYFIIYILRLLLKIDVIGDLSTIIMFDGPKAKYFYHNQH